MRFAAPEQLKAKKKRAPYDFKVDVYSLGVVLLDLFRSHDISFSELSDIHSAMLKGVIEENLAKKMPLKAKQLVEKMVTQIPDERPTVLEVLTGDLVPPDIGLENI